MKTTYIFLLALILIAASSCKKTLQLSPEDSFGDANFWKNEAQITNYMVGLHNEFRNDQFQFFRLGEMRGGGLTTEEAFTLSLQESPVIEQRLEENVSGVNNWAGFYSPILQINLFIQKVEAAGFLGDDKKKYLLGQAYAMRAYYYFHLLRTYGGVPLRLTPDVANGITDPVLLRMPRATEAEVLASVKSDVDKAVGSFGTATAKGKGQWSPAAALMLKGEIYLWSAKVYGNTADLATAKTALNAVTGTSLLPKFSDVFAYANKKNSEIIFAISFMVNEAEMSTVSLFTYDLPGIAQDWYADSLASAPKLTDPLNIGQVNSKQIIQRYRYSFRLFQSYDNLDQRKAATFYDLYKVDKTSGAPVVKVRNTVLRKFLGTFDAVTQKRYFSDDWPVYREADRLLMLAEIVNAEGGDPSPYIKAVRDRAFGGPGIDPAPFVNSSKDANELAIFTERCKEFVHEGKRWYDLRRMKYGNEPLVFINAGHPFGVLNKATQAYKILWPIDANVWTTDLLVNQTPGYATSKPE